MTEHAWYVAYGSNLDRNRLMAYLDGGRHGDGGHEHTGARHSAPPTAEVTTELPGGLWFGGPSRKWAGGVAHYDGEEKGRVIGRAWRLRLDQFADVAAQETGKPPGSVDLTVDMVASGGVIAPGARYGRVQALAPIDGEPAATLSFTERPRWQAPSRGYVRTMARGLRQLGIDDDPIVAYLANQSRLSSDLVRSALAGPTASDQVSR